MTSNWRTSNLEHTVPRLFIAPRTELRKRRINEKHNSEFGHNSPSGEVIHIFDHFELVIRSKCVLWLLAVMWSKLFNWRWVMRGLEAGAVVTHACHQREAGLSVHLQVTGQ